MNVASETTQSAAPATWQPCVSIPEPMLGPHSIRRDRQADELRNVPRSGFPHDGGAMVLHRSLTDPQMRSDVLAGMPGEHESENLSLTRGQTLEMRGGSHAPRLLWRRLQGFAPAHA